MHKYKKKISFTDANNHANFDLNNLLSQEKALIQSKQNNLKLQHQEETLFEKAERIAMRGNKNSIPHHAKTVKA